jgi:hypothetical protein
MENQTVFFWVITSCRLVDKYLPTYKSTRRHNPIEHRDPHRRENLKSHIDNSKFPPTTLYH